MADRSKNEQYDIVAQAEDVLELYIKRYFELNRRMIKANKTKLKKPRCKTIALWSVLFFSISILSAILIYYL